MKLVAWVILAMPLHEWGHAWVAKKRGIFEKYTWTAIGPAVKLSKPFPKAHDYMSGIYASILSLPLWIVLYGWETMLTFVIFIMLLGSVDIIVMFSWKEVKAELEMHRKLEYYENKYGKQI